MTEDVPTSQRSGWAGFLALFGAAASFGLHMLYGRMHGPRGGGERAAAGMLDALHTGALALGLLAVVFSGVCLIKGRRRLGLIAFALAVGAVLNSLSCY